MTASSGNSAPVAPWRWGTILRIVAAFGLLFALTYWWARTLVTALLLGAPQGLYVALTVGGVLGTALLTAGLTADWSAHRRRRLAGAVALAWLLANVGLIVTRAGDAMPLWCAALAYVPGTFWVPWAAWMYAFPLSAATRWGGLAVTAGLAGGTVALLEVEGLTGDTRIDFAWRWSPPPTPPAPTAETAETADLTPTDHDYAEFLGPRRLGVVADAKLEGDWAAHPPRLVWKVEVGAGWGGFAVVGDFAVTQEQHGADECVVCRRVSDGRTVWVHRDPVRFDSSLGGPGPRATPTIAGGKVYTVGGTGLLNCLDGADGHAIWSADIVADAGGKPIPHGVCGSPLVVDDMVVVCPTGAEATLAAYNRKTGQRLWQAGVGGASYGSPLVAEVAGRRQILIYGNEGVAGYAISDGRVLWHHDWTNGQRNNCSQPIPCGAKRVLVSTGYDKGATLIEVGGPAEAPTVRTIWESRSMKTKFTTAIVVGDHVYGLDDGILACVALADGARVWKDGRYGHGQILLAGDKLLVQAESGAVALVEPSPDGLKELGRIPALSGKTWNNPALAGRHLLVRNDRQAACWELPLRGR